MAYKTVLETYVNETTELVHVYVNGEEIQATPSHPFYVPKFGWTKAINLRAGDILVLSNGEYVVVEAIQHEILESPIKVYNFEVEDFHTYFVGKSCLLVHNMCIEAGTLESSDTPQIPESSPVATPKSLEGGKGYESFDAAKTALGSPGENKAWHHIVEQNQIGKSNFPNSQIHNTKNLVAIESGFKGSLHGKISGIYSSKPDFTNGLTLRNWLAGQDFDTQFAKGLEILRQFGELTPTSNGWIFTPFTSS